MNKTSLLKTVVAIALLFTVNINADAQFGKLKRLAKSKVEQVINGQEEKNETPAPSNTTSADNNNDNNNSNSSSAKEGYDENGLPKRMQGESDQAFRIRSQRHFYKDNPSQLEKLDVEEAGNMTNYFGITGGDEAVIIRYYELKPGDLKTSNRGDEDGYWAAQMIVNAWRYSVTTHIEQCML